MVVLHIVLRIARTLPMLRATENSPTTEPRAAETDTPRLRRPRRDARGRGERAMSARRVVLLPQERAGVHIHEDPARIEAALDKDPPAPTDTRRGKP